MEGVRNQGLSHLPKQAEENRRKGRETETVYEKDAKGTQQPYVVSGIPEPVSSLWQRGGNPVVVGNIQAAVEALFQVEPHKIKVMKMN